jgi:UDPglucose 6-dehydrogenase
VLQIVDPKVSKSQIAMDLGQPAGAGEGSWQQVPDVLQVWSVGEE